MNEQLPREIARREQGEENRMLEVLSLPEIDFFENSSLGGLEVIEAIRNPGTKTDDVPT